MNLKIVAGIIGLLLLIGTITTLELVDNKQEDSLQDKYDTYIYLYVESRRGDITWYSPQDAYVFSHSRNPFINGEFYN